MICKTLSFVRLLMCHRKPLDFCYHLAELCSHISACQCKVRALSCIQAFLNSQHQKLSARYAIKTISGYSDKAIKSWAKRVVVEAGQLRPNWTRYTLERLQVINIPMSTWNLKLVNIQRASPNHVWGLNSMLTNLIPPLHSEVGDADLIRIPANSKSRFSIEEQFASKEQRNRCHSFLTSVRINRDLVEQACSSQKSVLQDPYKAPIG